MNLDGSSRLSGAYALRSTCDPERGSPRTMSDTQRLTGLHSVLEALRARRRPLHRLLVRGGRRRSEIEAVVKAASQAGVPIVEVGERELEPGGRSTSNPQGVVLEVGSLPTLDLEDLCGQIEAPRRLVILDGVEDPQNLGAIARVAEASGFQGLVLTTRRTPPLSPAVARASAGAIEWLPVARVPNLRRAINQLKSLGFWVFGADPAASDSLFELSDRVVSGDVVAVLGAEGRGLRPGVRQLVDHLVRIPTQGRVASLNVATAAAVLLFELARRGAGAQPR